MAQPLPTLLCSAAVKHVAVSLVKADAQGPSCWREGHGHRQGCVLGHHATGFRAQGQLPAPRIRARVTVTGEHLVQGMQWTMYHGFGRRALETVGPGVATTSRRGWRHGLKLGGIQTHHSTTIYEQTGLRFCHRQELCMCSACMCLEGAAQMAAVRISM